MRLIAATSILLSGSRARAQASDAKRWQLGEPAPLGYHVARKHTIGIVGGSLLAGGYGLSALYGVAFTTECYVPGADGGGSRPCDAEPLYRAAPLLFIPIAGPFLALTDSNVRRDGGAVFWFSTFGALQVAGAVLLAYDLAVPHYGLKRGEGTTTAHRMIPQVSVAPTYSENRPGLAVIGMF